MGEISYLRVLLLVPDNGSFIHVFPMGTAYIASSLRAKGHEVVIWSQDQYHYPDSDLTSYLDQNCFDIVGLGIQGGYYQYKKLLSISDAINNARKRPLYILGGHCASPEPEYFLRKTNADIVVIGEGEETIVDLTSALSSGAPLSAVKGIAYMRNGKCTITNKREPIKDLETISYPAWDLFDMNYYSLIRLPRVEPVDRAGFVLSGRGCQFSGCNFCYQPDKTYRPRTPGAIIEEIQILKKDYCITFIDFLDELLMASPERTTDLCEAFRKAKLDIRWSCNGRLNFARPDILRLMKESGCVFINYGIESLDNEMLRVMGKRLTVEQITKGVEATLAEGISPGLNIIWGNISETKEILWKGVEFLDKYDDHEQLRTIRPVTPYPGSELYYYAIEHGLLKDVEDFYENKLLNSDLLSVNFTNLTDEDFHKTLYEANKYLLMRYYDSKLMKSLDEADDLYLNKNANFRGFRQT